MGAHAKPPCNGPSQPAFPPLMLIADDPQAPRALHECPDCGLHQALGPLRPGMVEACPRCGAVLRRRRRNSLTITFALASGGLCLMVIATFWPLLDIRLTGMVRATTLVHLPTAMTDHGMTFVAMAVGMTTIAAPFLRLLLTVAVLAGLRTDLTRRHLAGMARIRDWLKPWAMIEVFMLGLFVAYSRLAAIATVEIGTGLYALAGLMLITATADCWIDEHAMWEMIGRHGDLPPPVSTGPSLGCSTCLLVSPGQPGDPCPRCETPRRPRKPQPIGRSWALLLTAAILYVPANLYPVLTVVRLGQGAPSTIIGGVRELIESKMLPLALLVFVASILVPVLKLVFLSILLVTTQRRSGRHLVGRTRLFRVVELIGRWSMIDVFMVSLLTALVRMGVIASVTPGSGAMAFMAVVVLTMFAALSFDPRVMWDRAEQDAPEPRVAAEASPA